jgi:site-specific DNA recombinase
VRTIFRSYLKLGSLNLLMTDLRKRRIVTKVRTLKSGEKVGGIPFTRGPLAHLLRNRFYIGEVAFKGEVLRGEQIAIVDRELFDAVQAKLDAQINGHKAARTNSEALLSGRIFDDRGNRMTPSHARKRGIKYRYYLSSALLQGQSERAGSISRVPAAAIEALVINSVRERLKLSTSVDDRRLISNCVTRVEIRPDKVVINVQTEESKRGKKGARTFCIPWRKPPAKRRREILLPDGIELQHARPIRVETRATLVAAIARGRRWLKELVEDTTINVESIAKRERCSIRQVNMTVSLAFLAPNLVRAAIEGRLPRGIGVERLRDAPVEWSRQHQMLGLPWQF